MEIGRGSEEKRKEEGRKVTEWQSFRVTEWRNEEMRKGGKFQSDRVTGWQRRRENRGGQRIRVDNVTSSAVAARNQKAAK
jgi:hypothetical protein